MANHPSSFTDEVFPASGHSTVPASWSAGERRADSRAGSCPSVLGVATVRVAELATCPTRRDDG